MTCARQPRSSQGGRALVPLLLLAGSLMILLLPTPTAHGNVRRASTLGSALLSGARVIQLIGPGSLMVRIPQATFLMGSTADDVLAAAASCAAEPLGHRCSEQDFANELGQRTLPLAAFWIDRTEVTVREYQRCVALGRCARAAFAAGGRRFERDELPVSLVSWHDARDYCAFRGARLPTEAEWERAARGPGARTYPWGQAYNSSAANHGRFGILPQDASDGYAELAPVASFPAGRTPEGVLDMAGNAAEWVADVYRENYADSPLTGSGRTRRSQRGGGWASGAAWLRGAARDSAPPDSRRPETGFRCAKSAAQSLNE